MVNKGLFSNCIVIVLFLLLATSCKKKIKDLPVLTLSNDQIVKAMVEIYSVKAAVDVNQLDLRDSVHQVYFKQAATIIGQPMEVIQADFEKLLLMPDSLIFLQNRALDTLRTMMDKVNNRPPSNIGIN
jgi:hypothetical protein